MPSQRSPTSASTRRHPRNCCHSNHCDEGNVVQQAVLVRRGARGDQVILKGKTCGSVVTALESLLRVMSHKKEARIRRIETPSSNGRTLGKNTPNSYTPSTYTASTSALSTDYSEQSADAGLAVLATLCLVALASVPAYKYLNRQ